MERRPTPFPAIVGQEELKRALLAVATNDALDGLLVRGEKGTAKSTAVRSLTDLLPEQRVVADCPYGCPPDDPERQCESCRARDDAEWETRPVPLVTLPLGATRERVVGTLSVADALDGDAEFDPGLLARANRGILYVDEVNLLDDHLVDVLLDAAASGINRVERDGVSVSHPAEFTLVGTMNPEEGDLRPQLRDRFALQATVTGREDIDERVAVIDRALDRRDDPEAFAADYESDTDALRERLQTARRLLDDVALPDEFKADIAELCRDAGVDGHRADIATARTAVTLAALDGRTKVIQSDLREAAEFTLPHRLQSQPFEDAPDPDDVLDDHFDEDGDGESEDGEGEGTDEGADDGGEEGTSDDEGDESEGGDGDDEGTDPNAEHGEGDDGPNDGGNDTEESDGDESDGPTPSPAGGDSEGEDADTPEEGEDDDADADEATPLVPGQQRADVGDTERPPVDDVSTDSATPGDGSRAQVDATKSGRGSRVRSERATPDDAIDAAASVRAAATEGRARVEERDLRASVRRGSGGTLVVFVVDASASMRPAMREAKGTVMSLLRDAYEQRDGVAFVAVAGDEAEVLLPPTNSVTLAARHLKDLPTGDRTPLPDGLTAAHRLVTNADADATLVCVVTDGRANVADGSPTGATRAAARRLGASDASVVVVDAGDDGAGLTGIIQNETGGQRIPLADLTAERVADAASAAREE
ncbi:magnesium chelatase subunit D [Haloplanus vescus]|uniref:Magnesium chelatase subunit D n=1 Tax=Haloplanus vescus TaxID=555874 RepID=A0A1H3YJ08_9EURY|nr:ATP-binding protein [Haloplanus vescus]SEA11536.1 magnesium chelatase subunit D [Haloplanus vescus]